MKFSITLLTLASAGDQSKDDQWYGPNAGPRTGQIGADGDRRYDDMEAIASKYWRKQGSTGVNAFDDRKYWTYGCHCLMLGDRPMSQMGHGRPVDALDTKCKAYKDCQKCVREKHGDECIGEFVRYTYSHNSVITNHFGCANTKLKRGETLFVLPMKGQ